MTENMYDVVVVGAGAVGLAAALSAVRAGFSTCLVGPAPTGRDGRTAALLAGSVTLLRGLGLGDAIEAVAAPLATLRIVDATGSLFAPPPVAFEAREIGQDAFGWNIENATLVSLLAEAAEREPRLVWMRELAGGLGGEPGLVLLADGGGVRGKVVVAADGARSQIRQAAGIVATERRYDQAAFTTILDHAREHGDASTEFHTRAGPFTLVPLPGRRSSLVWVTTPRHAERLKVLGAADLARAVEDTSRHLLGRMEANSPRAAVPLRALHVDRLRGHRVVLVGEAAHLLPPIGAQGLNLGFADVAALIDAFRKGAGDPGSPETLGRYERARSLDIRLRGTAVDGLNRALLTDLLPVDALRGLGLGLLGRVGPLRRAVMRAGLGAREARPTAMHAPPAR